MTSLEKITVRVSPERVTTLLSRLRMAPVSAWIRRNFRRISGSTIPSSIVVLPMSSSCV
jgi:hypothetical protein